MDNGTIVKITNRSVGSLGYSLPELHVRRHFTPRETKEITFEELKALYQSDGGAEIIKQNLAIKDTEAIKELGFDVEPEYFYSEDDIKKIMVSGSLDEFLDMLDFGPDGVLDIVKGLAVSLPLNDINKRDAILEKLNFNVTKAIEIQNTKFDGGDEDNSHKENGKVRRVSTSFNQEEQAPSTPTRRVVVKK